MATTRVNRATSLAALCLLSACTWVKPIAGAGDIALIKPEAAEACRRIGATRVTTASEVGILDRSDAKMADEMLTLARNEAVRMGGNAIVEGEMLGDGAQRFIIYRCD